MRPRRAAAALEFALVLPVLLLLVFAIVDWSWYQMQAMTVHMAATRGARIAASAAPSRDPAALAEAATRAWLDLYLLDGSAATVQVEVDAAIVSVAVTMPHEPLAGLSPLPERLGSTASAVYYGDEYEE